MIFWSLLSALCSSCTTLWYNMSVHSLWRSRKRSQAAFGPDCSSWVLPGSKVAVVPFWLSAGVFAVQDRSAEMKMFLASHLGRHTTLKWGGIICKFDDGVTGVHCSLGCRGQIAVDSTHRLWENQRSVSGGEVGNRFHCLRLICEKVLYPVKPKLDSLLTKISGIIVLKAELQ